MLSLRLPVSFLFAAAVALASEADSTTPGQIDKVILQVLERPAERILAAYNAGNLKALRAELARSAPGLADDAALERLFVGYYRADFGRLIARRLAPKATNTHRDRGVLAYVAAFEKAPRAAVFINFTRENGELKIAQLRIERIESAK
jgi:hypothetical protein